MTNIFDYDSSNDIRSIKFAVSDKPKKKYYAYNIPGKPSKYRVYFGARDMNQYKDATGINAYSHLDWKGNIPDQEAEQKRKNFRSRFRVGSRDIPKYSPLWFTYMFLW